MGPVNTKPILPHRTREGWGNRVHDLDPTAQVIATEDVSFLWLVLG